MADHTEIPKKRWKKPTVFILARTRSEEAVLVKCRAMLTTGGFTNANSGCYTPYGACVRCSDLSAS